MVHRMVSLGCQVCSLTQAGYGPPHGLIGANFLIICLTSLNYPGVSAHIFNP